MEKKAGKPWFPRKKYGVGWGLPVTWQGWVVLILYILMSMIGTKFFLTDSMVRIPLFLLYFFIITGVFVFVCWKKGEKIDL